MKPSVYSIPQRAIHWLTALLIFYNLLLPGRIGRVDHQLGKGEVPTPEDMSSATIHIYIGAAILCLAVLRLVLRAVQGAPEPPMEEPPLFRLLSKVAHGLLYLLLILIPVTGLAKYYGGISFAGSLHEGPLKLLMWVLLIAHIAAVFVHKFYWKTNVVERMTRG